ncbi:hypothetical protein SBE55_10345 [Mycolicibacterium sp. 141076]|uniref:hypothetical protein n=1 Tax=Mycolicibacterium sp. 141076 TaxID=3090599 RepID=UPI00299EB784|nr:hypothetical protein [Mycolicibacterium sp. 141076]MDX1878217.1 hypothetical protein [Mycolicibacterium sp. 141076]
MLNERHLELVLYCCGQELAARRAGKKPGVQQWNSEVIRAVELELAVTRTRQSERARDSCSKYEHWIDSTVAAGILGWSLRRVQRHAADLDGHKIASGAWLFPATVVYEYAAGLKDGRATA